MSCLYAVIGNPIAQSKSPFIHARFADAMGEDIVYVAVEAEPGDFVARMDSLRRRGARGVNITAPFKLNGFAYATESSQRARRAGAVNAMKFEGARALGENFDGVGLLRDIEVNLEFSVAGRRVLIAGAGGAGRGAIAPMLAARPSALVVVNRTVDKAQSLARDFASDGPIEGRPFGDLEQLAPFDLVINATSASQKAELPPIPPRIFSREALAYEMVYGRGLTPFLAFARAAQVARIADGVGMLVEQAAEAFAWWRGLRPETKPVIAELEKPLF